jgi:coenzyme F420-reducing hydrogenase beta subunit
MNYMICYAVKNKDLNVRLNSSSGGVFTALAAQIINEGGNVIGVNSNIEYQSITKIEDINLLRGSKYVESKTNYNLIDDHSMFVGTPCQMENKAYLKIDLICHGTPTRESYNKYIKEHGEFKFRDKKNGWIESTAKNQFMSDFLRDKNLCKKCYNCQFKELKSRSDITLGDFWGINNEYPEFFDNYGVSAVIIKTIRGKEYFDKIKDKIDYIEVDINKVIKYNPSLVRSAKNENSDILS